MKGSLKQAALLLFILPLLFFRGELFAQIEDPVEWSFEKEETAPGSYRLFLDAGIEAGWHLYSTELPEDATPLPTVVEFEDNEQVSLQGEVKEEGVVTDADPISGEELSFFKEKGRLIQEVKVEGEGSTELKGFVEFMVCDDERCLPPSKREFSFELEGSSASEGAKTEEEGAEKEGSIEEGTEEARTAAPDSAEEEAEKKEMVDPVDWSLEAVKEKEGRYILRLRATIDEGWHLYATELAEGDGPVPTSIEFEEGEGQNLLGPLRSEEATVEYDPNFQRDLSFYKGAVIFEQVLEASSDEPGKAKASVEFMACDDERCTFPKTVELSAELKKAEKGEVRLGEKKDTEESEGEHRGLLTVFLLCFGGGFVALLTPCVFPMIPLTVSFFTKQSPTRSKGISNALIYSASIIIIYTSVGYLVTRLFGAGAMNAISTDPYMNIFFFLIILLFAISFLGGFDLNLPESWIDRSDKLADKGGLIGIFFMAFTLALVSFSCTAPIIGPLLVQTAAQGGLGPVVGMAGFSLALALPFGIFAAFPAWLNSLPSSGGWMNTVKVTLGFLELALAFKFLSNADLVTQAGLLKRELFLAIWIGIFGVMGFYLLGLFRTPNDGETPRISVPRLLIATTSIVFTLYLIPGLFGAPLKLISGFPPPQFYSEWKGGQSESGFQASSGTEEEGDGKSKTAHGECPLNLDCFHDYEKALAHAKEVNKPLMIDFTGWACVNCRRMEENVWTDPEVLEQLRDEVVLASLYVDDRTELPEEEWKTVEKDGEKTQLKRVGKKWSHFQTTRFKANTQPYYVLLDHDEEELVEPTGYEPNVTAFSNWLEKGIANFKD